MVLPTWIRNLLKYFTPSRRKPTIVLVEWEDLEFSFRTDWFVDSGGDFLDWNCRETIRFRHIRDHPVDHNILG